MEAVRPDQVEVAVPIDVRSRAQCEIGRQEFGRPEGAVAVVAEQERVSPEEEPDHQVGLAVAGEVGGDNRVARAADKPGSEAVIDSRLEVAVTVTEQDLDIGAGPSPSSAGAIDRDEVGPGVAVDIGHGEVHRREGACVERLARLEGAVAVVEEDYAGSGQNRPPPSATIVPSEAAVPSPQSMLAVKSEAGEAGLAQMKLATVPVNAMPSTACTSLP